MPEGYLFLRSIRQLNLIKYYVNFVDNLKKLMYLSISLIVQTSMQLD